MIIHFFLSDSCFLFTEKFMPPIRISFYKSGANFFLFYVYFSLVIIILTYGVNLHFSSSIFCFLVNSQIFEFFFFCVLVVNINSVHFAEYNDFKSKPHNFIGSKIGMKKVKKKKIIIFSLIH